MARGKSKGKRPSEKRIRRAQQRLKRKVKQDHGHLRFGPATDGVRMSEVVEQFMEPYMAEVETVDDYRKLVSMAALAWNAGLFPAEEIQPRLDALRASLSLGMREMAMPLIQELVQRKRQHFGQYQRMILDFEVAETGNKWHLTVVSVAEPL